MIPPYIKMLRMLAKCVHTARAHDSLKLIWLGFAEHNPKVIPLAAVITIIGFFFVLVTVYFGFYAGPDPMKELKAEI